MDRPTFLILGAAKCGTTTLYAWLDQHPDTCMSRPKETEFFLRSPGAPLDRYWRDHFGHWDGEAAAGEATPGYLRMPGLAERLREVLPAARVIVLLRDPVERAYAHWWMHRTGGWERLSFRDAIEANLRQPEEGVDLDASDSGPHWRAYRDRAPGTMPVRPYVETGHYALHLQRYLRCYPRDQLGVWFLRDLERQPLAVLHEVWDFLGLAAPAGPLDLQPQNEAEGMAVGHLRRLPLARRVFPRVPRPLKAAVRRGARLLTARPAMPPDVAARLREHYAPHDRALEDILGHGVGPWSRVGFTAARP